MNCPVCGNQASEGETVCKNCGAGLTGMPPAINPEAMTQPPEPETTQAYTYEEKYAGFWIRVLSSAFDGLILIIGGFVIGVILGFIFKERFSFAMSQIIGILINLSYFTYMHGKYGQTLGKMAFGIKVFQSSGEEMTYGIALVRWIGYMINVLTIFIGYLMVAFKRNKRGLHDVIADTKVVYVKKPSLALIIIIAFLSLAVPIGIMAAVSLPKFMALQTKVKEGKAKGNLAIIRANIMISYADNEGIFPSDMANELVPKYMASIPLLELPRHSATNEIRVITNSQGKSLKSFVQDSGQWLYMADRESPDWGTVIVDCAHADSKGIKWYEY